MTRLKSGNRKIDIAVSLNRCNLTVSCGLSTDEIIYISYYIAHTQYVRLRV